MMGSKRKVIGLAGRTFVISLPNDWIKRYEVKKGEELSLIQRGRELILSIDKPVSFDAVEVTLSGPERVVYYRYGLDEIKVNYQDQKVVQKIRELIREQLMGYEIIKISKSHCIVKSIAKANPEEFPNILRRLFLLTLSQGRELYNALMTKDYEALPLIASYERDNNKLVNYSERLMNKFGATDHHKTCFTFGLVQELDHVGDIFRDICNYTKENREISNDTLFMLQSCIRYFEQAYHLYYTFSVGKREKIRNMREEIRSSIQKQLQTGGLSRTDLQLLTDMRYLVFSINHMIGFML